MNTIARYVPLHEVQKYRDEGWDIQPLPGNHGAYSVLATMPEDGWQKLSDVTEHIVKNLGENAMSFNGGNYELHNFICKAPNLKAFCNDPSPSSDWFLIHRGPSWSFKPSPALKRVLKENREDLKTITTVQSLVHRSDSNIGIYETYAVQLTGQ